MKSSKEFSFEIQDGNICNGECLHKLNVVIPEVNNIVLYLSFFNCVQNQD